MNYGLNYMGSKNAIAADLVQYMLIRHPDRNVFVDATAGGMSMTHYILRETSDVKVIANDLNPYFMDLYMMMATNPDVVKEFAYTWCNREYINTILKNPETEPNKWKVAVANTIWSFGGKGESYLYSVEISGLKRSVFDAVMYNLWGDELLDFKATLPTNLLTNDGIDFTNKRLEIVRLYGAFRGEQFHLENLNRAERLVTMCDDLYNNRHRLKLVMGDYKDVVEKYADKYGDKAIIYLDPPYENTAEYMVQDINYDVFWGFTESYKDKLPIYVSSYDAPSNITKVWEKGKTVALASSKHRKIKIERLYYNNYKVDSNALFDLLG